MVPFESLDVVSYSHSIATMAVFLAICEIFLYLALNNGVTLKRHSLLIQLSVNVESFIILPTCDKMTLFSSQGNLAVQTLSKIVSTIQDSTNAVSVNTFLGRYKCLECLPSPFTYSYQTIRETRDSFINWTYGKLTISSPMRLLIQKLFWASDEGFKIASCVAPQT